jgi:hypothetical protein
LEDNVNDEKQKPNEEIDPFSKFLFGNRKPRDTYNESNNSQGKNEHLSYHRRSNRIDDWFFGRKKEPKKSASPTLIQIEKQIENPLNNVDFELVMETIDMLIKTANQYKPLIKEFTPYLNNFMKKFKSK